MAHLHHDDCQRQRHARHAAHEGAGADERKGAGVNPRPGAGRQEHPRRRAAGQTMGAGGEGTRVLYGLVLESVLKWERMRRWGQPLSMQSAASWKGGRHGAASTTGAQSGPSILC